MRTYNVELIIVESTFDLTAGNKRVLLIMGVKVGVIGSSSLFKFGAARGW